MQVFRCLKKIDVGALIQNECEHINKTMEIRSQDFLAVRYNIYCDDLRLEINSSLL